MLVKCISVPRKVYRHKSDRSIKRRAGSSGNNDDDFVTKVFGKLFGSASLEDQNPFGMQRIQNDIELYPAPVDDWADPIPGDPPEVAVLRQLLKNTQLEKLPLRLAYDANTQGWDAEAFHRSVDTFGACLVVAQTRGGAVIGGYNPRGYINLNEPSRDSIAAFLFTWTDGKVQNARPVKLPKIGGPSYAVVDQLAVGIQFGVDGLSIPLRSGREKFAKCRLGTYYQKMPDGSRSLFAQGESPKSTELTSLQAWVAQGEGESFELDGIIWKSKWVEE